MGLRAEIISFGVFTTGSQLFFILKHLYCLKRNSTMICSIEFGAIYGQQLWHVSAFLAAVGLVVGAYWVKELIATKEQIVSCVLYFHKIRLCVSTFYIIILSYPSCRTRESCKNVTGTYTETKGSFMLLTWIWGSAIYDIYLIYRINAYILEINSQRENERLQKGFTEEAKHKSETPKDLQYIQAIDTSTETEPLMEGEHGQQ